MRSLPKKLLLFCFLSATIATAADTISGTVRNQSTGKPAVGDTVILLRLGDGMQEEAKAKIDAQGAFTFRPTVANAQYLLRVLHQGVNYDQTVTGTAPLELTVFDAVSKVAGLSGNIGIVQMESAGGNLKVTEMYAITNASAPPVTQASPHDYDFSLPGNATLDFVQVKGPKGKIWVNVQPVLIQGQTGRYSVDFPIRPGDTLFKIAYHVRYAGPTTFHLKLAYPIEKLAVMLPPSMSFKALKPGTFNLIGNANGFMIENAVARPVVGQIPGFEISATGAPPSPASAAKTPSPKISAAPTSGSNTAAPVKTPNTPASASSSGLWLMLAGLAVVLTVVLFAAWWYRSKPASMKEGNNDAPRPLFVDALKEELFQLESDRLRGSISAEEYTEIKQALNQSIQRALSKNGSQKQVLRVEKA
jgi:hypothetical protein